MATLKKPRRPKSSGSRPKASGKKTIKRKIVRKKASALKLRKSAGNPIIKPSESEYWESKATFNPTAVYHDGKVHVVYRAIGDNDVSVLGYAESEDGNNFRRHKEPVYYSVSNRLVAEPIADNFKIDYCSGGGWNGGCEDPRLTKIGDIIYLLFTAFNGWGSVRITLTSISLEDFISHKWNWRSPVLISPPGEIHKNWVLFPEKINGKYAILHSISPKIMIDYFDSLKELDGRTYIHSVHQRSPLWETRDKLIRGVGPAPLRTKYGWLVLYHKMERKNPSRYKLWAMILDAKDPTKILFNSTQPILEPDEWYENEGHKTGVVYSCGAVIKDKKLFVYYGGADKVSCVAMAELDSFLKELTHSGVSILKKGKIKMKA